MENKFEISVNPEQLEKESKVTLHFFRHGEPKRDLNKSNPEYELTEIGRKQAIEKSKTIKIKNPDQARAFGSPRWRSMQTAGLVLTGDSSVESFKDLEVKLNQEKEVILKLDAKAKLNFHLDKNSPFGKEAYRAVFEDHDYLRFLVERSDELALKNDDKLASTYSSQARNVAKMIKVYSSIGKKWNKLIEGGKYKNPNLERCLGSHGGVLESFLLKVIEKTKGIADRDKLLEIMPHQFDYLEGFEINIVNKGPDQKIHISYKKEDKNNPEKIFIFNEDIPFEILDEIIKEKEIMNKKF